MKFSSQAAAQDGRNLEDWNEDEPQETEMEKELKRIAEQEEVELCKARYEIFQYALVLFLL